MENKKKYDIIIKTELISEEEEVNKMKIYHICEVQDNTMNYIIMQDMKGKSKIIDWDLNDDEIAEIIKEFEKVGGELESRV